MSVFDSTKFKALKKKWDQRLKKAGFRDIEDAQGRFTDHRTAEDFIARLDGKRGMAKNPKNWPTLRLELEAVREYHSWAEDMANHGRFKSTADKKIWRLHAQGMSTHKIADHVPLSQVTICARLKVIREYLRMQPQRTDDN